MAKTALIAGTYRVNLFDLARTVRAMAMGQTIAIQTDCPDLKHFSADIFFPISITKGSDGAVLVNGRWYRNCDSDFVETAITLRHNSAGRIGTEIIIKD